MDNTNIRLLDVSGFLNRDNVLDSGLGVYNKPYDYIHLGKQGIRMLANIFKNGIFKQFVDGRSYSGVLVNRGGAGYTPFPALS